MTHKTIIDYCARPTGERCKHTVSVDGSDWQCLRPPHGDEVAHAAVLVIEWHGDVAPTETQRIVVKQLNDPFGDVSDADALLALHHAMLDRPSDEDQPTGSDVHIQHEEGHQHGQDEEENGGDE